MDDNAARTLVESVLAPDEVLLWSEAAPASNPAVLVHFLLTLGLLGLAIGVGLYAIQLWTVFLPALRRLKTRLNKVLSLVALALVSVVLAILVAVSVLGGLLNGFKVLSEGAAAYAITDRQALFVFDVGGAPYVEALQLNLLRIDRDGHDLRLHQPLSTELFGVTFETVFHDLDDAAAVEAMIRALALRKRGAITSNGETGFVALDAETMRALSPVLYADESVVWAQRAMGRPYWLNATLMLAIMGFFGLLLLVAAFAPSLQWGDGSRDVMGFRLVLGPIGLALTLWALSSAGWSLGSGHVYYALTDRRLVVAHTEPWLEIREFGPWYFDDVEARGDRVSFCERTGRRSSCNNDYLPGVREPELVAARLRALYLVGRRENTAPAE